MARRRIGVATLALGLLGSQAGHLLAYQVRYGAAAQQLQSSGAHAYFPLLAKTALGVGACALIGGLLLVGLARLLTGRRVPSASEPSYLSLLAILFSIQLAAFAVQEVGEALLGGLSTGTVVDLLLWGTLGQLPIAAFAALALRWLCARIEAAVGAIRALAGPSLAARPPAAVAIPVPAAPGRALLPFLVAASSLTRRGPPSYLRMRTD
jgi:hypothetical protein